MDRDYVSEINIPNLRRYSDRIEVGTAILSFDTLYGQRNIQASLTLGIVNNGQLGKIIIQVEKAY